MSSHIRAFLLYTNWLTENEIASEGDTHDKRFFLLHNFQYPGHHLCLKTGLSPRTPEKHWMDLSSTNTEVRSLVETCQRSKNVILGPALGALDWTGLSEKQARTQSCACWSWKLFFPFIFFLSHPFFQMNHRYESCLSSFVCMCVYVTGQWTQGLYFSFSLMILRISYMYEYDHIYPYFPFNFHLWHTEHYLPNLIPIPFSFETH